MATPSNGWQALFWIMIKKYQVLAIIPARGGSKRVPGKNIKELGGKPMIAYSIEHAQDSKYVDRTVISTDDLATAGVAKQFGAEVPFMRPAELAGDTVTDLPVFQHALSWLKENENYVPDIVVQLRPTSPLRKVADVDHAIELLADHPEADSVRTVLAAEPSPYKMYKIGEPGHLEPVVRVVGEQEGYNLPQQKLPKAYRHIGTADVIWTKTLTEKGQMSGEKILPLIVEKAYTGVNTPEDWELYEFLVGKKR